MYSFFATYEGFFHSLKWNHFFLPQFFVRKPCHILRLKIIKYKSHQFIRNNFTNYLICHFEYEYHLQMFYGKNDPNLHMFYSFRMVVVTTTIFILFRDWQKIIIRSELKNFSTDFYYFTHLLEKYGVNII